jgi:hypothetical protein
MDCPILSVCPMAGSAVCSPAPSSSVVAHDKTLATLEHLMHAAAVRGDKEAAIRYWREIGVLLGSCDA